MGLVGISCNFTYLLSYHVIIRMRLLIVILLSQGFLFVYTPSYKLIKYLCCNIATFRTCQNILSIYNINSFSKLNPNTRSWEFTVVCADTLFYFWTIRGFLANTKTEVAISIRLILNMARFSSKMGYVGSIGTPGGHHKKYISIKLQV